MRKLLFALAIGLAFLPSPRAVASGKEIKAVDADNHEIAFNPAGKVCVLIISSEDLQEETRSAGRALDSFQGLPNFRHVILVDLRDSLGGLVPDIVRSRMREELSEEAHRLKPLYEKNGNHADPRANMVCVPDFNGKTCALVNWSAASDKLRVIVFSDGKEVKRWDNLKNYTELTDTVKKALGTAKP